jgi:hypothetical protein
MSRYIDADNIKLKGIAALDENLDFLVSLSDVRKSLQMTPTADVVPRAEVEEIFSELYKEIESALNSNYKARRERINGCGARDMFLNVVDGKIASLRGLHEFIEYLEEKHTGGE